MAPLRGSRRLLTVVAAHDVLRVRDCVARGCIADAENGSDRCWRHRDWVPAPPDLVEDGLMGRLQPQYEPKKVCRIDGCTNPPREGAPSRGPHANLCEDHRQVKRQTVAVAPKEVEPPKPLEDQVSRPEPGHSFPGVDGFEARAARLVEAGRRLDEARATLETANRVHDEAEADWKTALSLAHGDELVAVEA